MFLANPNKNFELSSKDLISFLNKLGHENFFILFNTFIIFNRLQ